MTQANNLATHPDECIWAQKYRPNKLDDVIIPLELRESLRKHISAGKVPNLLLYSTSPGTGKTTVALAICAELGVKPLFINASLDNSIDDVRSKVVQYATTCSLFGESQKVVVLDECERLSPAAQEALKGLIESVSANCSFILTSNTKSRIVDPLRSRCTEIDFVYDTKQQTALAMQMFKRTSEILTAEGVTFTAPVLVAVIKKYMPDNRRILNEVQRYASESGTIDAGILGRLKGVDAETLSVALKQKNFDDVKAWAFNNFDRVGDDFYGSLFKTLSPSLTPQSVPQLVLLLNDYQRYHATVPDRYIHTLAMLTEIMVQVTFKAV